MEGIDKNGRGSVDRARLKTLTILGDEIPCNEFSYWVNSDPIKLRLKSEYIEH